MFRLMNLSTGEYLHNARTNLSYEDGRKAARAAKIASAILKTKIQPRKCAVGGDDNWREREQRRFTTGEYTPLIDALHEWSRKAFPDHFAHNAQKRPDLIAYTKNEEKGRDDKQSLIGIDAYVRMVSAKIQEMNYSGWSNSFIEVMVSRQREHAGAFERPYQLATTPDDIYRVYSNHSSSASSVSSSCMRYSESSSQWPRVDGRRYSPVRVYGAGDLAVAYIANDDGQTVARCLVWPDRKIYSRMYADNDALATLLKADGYSKSSYYGETASMAGAKLLLVRDDNDQLIAPYLDEVGYVSVYGDHLKIGGDLKADSTSGTIEDEPRYVCEGCGNECDEDDTTYIYTDARGYNGESWCRCCVDSNTFYCAGNQAYYADSVDHDQCDGETYTLRYLENNATWCDAVDMWAFDTVEVIVNDDGDTETWPKDHAESNAYEYNDKWYSDDLDYTSVIVERYVPHVHYRSAQHRRNHKGEVVWEPRHAINVWYRDITERIPTYLIDAGDVDVAWVGDSNKCYLRGYRDNYPVAREHYAATLIELMEAA